jgi:S-methylmethionine-dependent homocysteine/selenocysteine methylase
MTVTILDGGMGRELLRIGAPFRQPEWSALALMEGPEWVTQAHQNFVDAGSTVITTNSYACVPFHLGADVFTARGRELVNAAGRLAREVADRSEHVDVQVAGSIPPVFGSYRPDLFDAASVDPILEVLVDELDQYVDIWLIETVGSIGEAIAALAHVRARAPRPVWVSFTLNDVTNEAGFAELRSGEGIPAAIAALGDIGALLFNCSQPEVMAAAVSQARPLLTPQTQIGVYANAFPTEAEEKAANEDLHEIRSDLTPERYASFAQEWVDLGATMVGGCCGIRPDHIAALAQHFG